MQHRLSQKTCLLNSKLKPVLALLSTTGFFRAVKKLSYLLFVKINFLDLLEHLKEIEEQISVTLRTLRRFAKCTALLS